MRKLYDLGGGSLLGFVLTTLLLLAGCGDGSGDFVSIANNNAGGQLLLPPGTVITQGTGPVANQAAADQRILQQFLGLPRADVRAQTVAFGPLINMYRIPGGLVFPGTSISEADSPDAAFSLSDAYFIYWRDPNPLANLGHKCSMLYLRAKDGLIVEQEVDFDPLIAQVRVLELDSDKAANLLYTHPDWRDLGAAPGLSPVTPRVLAQMSTPGVGQPGGPAIGGLGVAGAPEARRAADLTEAANLFEAMGGNKADFDTLDDDPGARKDKNDLETAIKEATTGLGDGDKFLFVLSSHGSKAGKFCMGTDQMTWAELCKLLDDNVTAGNINLVIDTCYAGTAIAEFDKWAATSTKRVRVVTSTDDTPSYSRPNGLGFNLECAIKDLKDKLTAAKGDGTLTLDELEQAMADTSFTQEEIDGKICKFIGDDPPGTANLSAAKRAWKNDYLDKEGAATNVERTTPGKKTGFDNRPLPQTIEQFLEAWRVAVSSDDPLVLEPFYVPNFIYDGRNFEQINSFGTQVDVEIVALSLQNVQPITIDTTDAFDVQVTLERDLTVSGPPTIEQHENQTVRFRVFPVDSPGQGEPGFDIYTQQVLVQEYSGTLTGTGQTTPTVFPSPPLFVDLTIQQGPLGFMEDLMPGDSLVPSDFYRAFMNLGTGGAGSTGLTFGGVSHPMPEADPNFYSTGFFNAPPLAAEQFFLMSVFAENRDVTISGQLEAYRGFTRTIEVVTPPADE